MLHTPYQVSHRLYLQAGLLYLVVIATGFFSLGYVPAHTRVPGDALATAQLLSTVEPLFRLGMLSDLTLSLAFLLLPFALYRLMHPLHPPAARLMVALAALSFPLALWNLGPKLELLTAVRGGSGMPALSGVELEAAVTQALRAHRQGLLLQQVCWGGWLIPLGWLVRLGGLRPRVLGHLLIGGGLGYLIHVVGTLGWAGYLQSSLPKVVRLPATVAELGVCMALLFHGFAKTTPQGAGEKGGLLENPK